MGRVGSVHMYVCTTQPGSLTSHPTHTTTGEGIVAVDDKVVQITWKERKALVYGRQNLTFLNDFIYGTSNNEGWGITTDGERLIVSDGSSNLMFWDKDTYKEIPDSRLRVEDGFGHAVTRLNELEYAYGYIWANIWCVYLVSYVPCRGRFVFQTNRSAPTPTHAPYQPPHKIKQNISPRTTIYVYTHAPYHKKHPHKQAGGRHRADRPQDGQGGGLLRLLGAVPLQAAHQHRPGQYVVSLSVCSLFVSCGSVPRRAHDHNTDPIAQPCINHDTNSSTPQIYIYK
jgi:hypothetical protein